MTHLTPRLAADESGSSIIELALAAPLLAALLIGMVDLSRAYSTKLQVEQGAQRAIERIQQEGYENTTTYKDTLKADAAAGAGVLASAVTINAWLECDNDGVQESFTGTCTGTETVSRYVSVAVEKTYDPMFSVRYAGANADGTYTVHGEAGVRVQ